MPRPTATTTAATAAAFPSLPKLSKWLPKLGLPRRRRHLTRPCRASPSRSPSLSGINAAAGGGGGGGDRRTCGFSEVFRRFDADGDGKISGAELLSFLTSAGEVGVSPEDVERVVGELDSDGDGLMDYGDFVRLMGRGGGGGGKGGEADREEKDDEDLRAAFEMFVAEKGAGCITPEGLRRALGRLGEQKSQEECAAMIRAFDADGNGVLDYQEFCRMMTT